MIIKLYILQDNKIILNKFVLLNKNNTLELNNTTPSKLIKIPVYNIYNGLFYTHINLPLILNIVNNNYIFNPYIILSSYNQDNDIDFFYQLKKTIFDNYNLTFINITDNFNIINMYNTIDILNKNVDIIWNNINIIITIFILCNLKSYKYPNNYYKLLNNFKFKLFIDSDLFLDLKSYMNYDYNKQLTYNDINSNSQYYIQNNLLIKKIFINNKQNLISYHDYKFYNHNPNIDIDINYIIFNTYINIDIVFFIIKNIININDNSIINYYYNNYILSYLKYMYDDFYILKQNNYDNLFFINLTKKYEHNMESIINIFTILFNNYIYPLKSNKNELDDTFDRILYFSLYNYSKITTCDNDINIILPINNLIPIKLKSLYINTIKIFINVINGNINYVIINYKFFNDILHRNIIKLFLIDNNKIAINLFKTMVSNYVLNDFKNIVINNLLLIDLSSKLSWNNISNRLDYIKIFFNYNIIQNKYNILNNLDIKIKKIIKNPFDMYKYLKTEDDFIIWTQTIENYIKTIYYIPILLSFDDMIYIAKIIFLLFNVKEQNLKEISYTNFISYCNLHKHLIISSNRINIKVKEYFPTLKLNINLGILTKHILLNNKILIFNNYYLLNNI